MDKRLLIAGIGLVIFALVSVPVMAAPPATVNPVDQILVIVKDIQTNVGLVLTKLTPLQTDVTTILTKLQPLQTDVTTTRDNTKTILTKLQPLQTDITTIKTTTDTINGKLNSPPKPTGYVYYSGIITPPIYGQGWFVEEYVVNWGDTPADVTFTQYTKQSSEDWQEHPRGTITLQPGEYKADVKTVMSDNYLYRVKISTNSPYVAPTSRAMDISGNNPKEYRPGDFLKEEIYS